MHKEFYSSTPLAVGSAVFGAGDGPVWITDLACTGTEANIANCRHSAYGVTKCRHYEDAGVVCTRKFHVTPFNMGLVWTLRVKGILAKLNKKKNLSLLTSVNFILT